jgi:S-(hydroxymethyl)glutathione dehydrogenase / alcohol dehydrogenase
MRTIKAAICEEFGKPLVIRDVLLRAPLAGEVEVTVEACGICHSDITFIDGGWGGTLPAVYGHEVAGKITAIGAGVTGYKLHDTVIATLIRSCRSCVNCTTGMPVLCDTPYDRDRGPLTLADGGVLSHGMAVGGFAERVVVDQSQLARIPAAMPMDAASLLACGVITGLGAAVNTANVRPGQNVVVIGAGGVGLNAIQGARIAGAARIIAVDMSAEKLAVAQEFGATDGVLATLEAPWDEATRIAGRGADAVFVTVGSPKAYDAAPNYLGYGGKVYMVGMPHSGAQSTYVPVNLAYMGQGMAGTKMGDTVLSRDIPWLSDLYSQGRLKLDELISGRWSLDQINLAIADTKSGAARRNVIVF